MLMCFVGVTLFLVCLFWFCFSSRRRHTRCALVTGVQTCALPIYTQILRSAFRLTPDRISPTRRITMRLYLTSTGEWTGNQSDAAGLVRANGGTWAQIEVPTDKPGLIAWLTQPWTHSPTSAAPENGRAWGRERGWQEE